MSKFLLDYVFPITEILPTPQASTAFLKQLCLVCTPKSGQEGNVGTVYECSTAAQVAARTDNEDAIESFAAGMSKVYILLASSLTSLPTYLAGVTDFWTLLLSSDFNDNSIGGTKATASVTITSYANLLSGTPDTISVGGTAFVASASSVSAGAAAFYAQTDNATTAAHLAAQINAHATIGELVVASASTSVVSLVAVSRGVAGNSLALAYADLGTSTIGATVTGSLFTGGTAAAGYGTFPGVVGASFLDEELGASFAATEKRVGFISTDSSKLGNNAAYAFGKLLSNVAGWKNQQYITMPESDGADSLGDANTYFDDRVSFVVTDDEFATRLGLFAAGGRAIVAPYILKNLMVDLQSAALTWISGNEPDYTLTEAALLETYLQEQVINQRYINTKLITAGVVEITLVNDNFVATGQINVAEPKALWRVFSQLEANL